MSRCIARSWRRNAPGNTPKPRALSAKVTDTTLLGYAQAFHFLSAPAQQREGPGSGRVAGSQSRKRYRRPHLSPGGVACDPDSPARQEAHQGRGGDQYSRPAQRGSRSGGYEDAELLPPTPASDVGRAVTPAILAAIRAGNPDDALKQLDAVRAAATPTDLAILTHRIAASYRAEGRDADAYRLATSVSDPAVPQLMWDAGFAAYRLGNWREAILHLEKLAETPAAQNTLRGQGAFWAARAHMQSGDALKVVTLLNFAAEKQPSFYGVIAERVLGIDTQTGFADAILNAGDFRDLMAIPAARRAVALWQIGEREFVGSELNRAFVDNSERLDPAMAALARAIGVPNVELRASKRAPRVASS